MAPPLRVMLIEDLPDHAVEVRAALVDGQDPVDVTVFTDLDAVDQALGQGVWDALILDLGVAGGDGLGGLERLMRMVPELPMVALSRGEDEELPVAAVKAGAQDCLVVSELGTGLLKRAVRYAIERKRMALQMSYMAHHDDLTGLCNRASFVQRLPRAMARARRREQRLALLFIDLDHFKRVNDTLGHETGDAVLAAVGERLVDAVRRDDGVFRLGGDEFTVLVENVDRVQDAEVVAEKLLAALDPPVEVDGHRVRLGASIGVAVGPLADEDAGGLRRRADAALYAAKAAGRGGYQLSQGSDDAGRPGSTELVGLLRTHRPEQLFELYFQPVVRARSREVVSAEALLRLHHPQKGLLPASAFVPFLEETGLILSLGHWALDRAAEACAGWQSGSETPLSVAVNLSARQLQDPDLHDNVVGVLEATGLPAELLELAVREEGALHLDRVQDCLRRLRARGVRITLDAFGAGRVSVSALLELPIDGVRLDMGFVRGIDQDPRLQAATAGLVELAHGLGYQVVAAGVETEGELACLLAAGCDQAQGYLLGTPGPRADGQREGAATG